MKDNKNKKKRIVKEFSQRLDFSQFLKENPHLRPKPKPKKKNKK